MIQDCISEEKIQALDAAKSLEQALCESSHWERFGYIWAKKGYHAVGGFFDPTRKKVLKKFVSVWTQLHAIDGGSAD